MTRRLRVSLFFSLVVAPNLAFAHAPIPGINNFYNGLLHPVLVPSHALLWFSAGLLFGQQQAKQFRAAFLSLLPAIVSGLVVSGFSPGSQFEFFILVMAAIIGLLVAASPRIPTYWCVIIAVVTGFSIGFDSAQESLSGTAKFVALLGSGIGIFFLTLYAFGLSSFCNSKKDWLRILIRVFGSWIAASALLVLALSISSTETWS